MMWAGERGFRKSHRGKGDLEMSWLISHLKVERWREALIWVWAVGRVGGQEGVWGDKAREEIKGLLGIRNGETPAEVSPS